jgi:hypothetical protein
MAVGGFSGAFILTTSIMVGYVVGWVPYSDGDGHRRRRVAAT